MPSIRIPHELFSRLDDVGFWAESSEADKPYPSTWKRCNEVQQKRLVEEAKHLRELIRDGGSIYEGIAAVSIARSCDIFLRKVGK